MYLWLPQGEDVYAIFGRKYLSQATCERAQFLSSGFLGVYVP